MQSNVVGYSMNDKVGIDGAENAKTAPGTAVKSNTSPASSQIASRLVKRKREKDVRRPTPYPLQRIASAVCMLSSISITSSEEIWRINSPRCFFLSA